MKSVNKYAAIGVGHNSKTRFIVNRVLKDRSGLDSLEEQFKKDEEIAKEEENKEYQDSLNKKVEKATDSIKF